MDFELKSTPQQERFRSQVRAWLEDHAPKDLVQPADPRHLTYEDYQKQRKLGLQLGEKGWLYPTYPREFGGGDLSGEEALIIEQELDRYRITLPPYYDSGGKLGAASILIWGTEEQKKHFLPLIVKGQARTWQLLTEPEAGSDLANVKTTALRDGDSYVINGQKIFVGSTHGADWSWMIVNTNPGGKRHENLSWFMVPMDLTGISWAPMDLLFAGSERGAASGFKQTVYFENVRVPAFNLIGGENNGWKVAGTHLELEHGSGGSIRRNRVVERLLEMAKKLKRDGKPLSEHSDIHDLLVDVFVETEITRLYGLRNYWMRHTHQKLAHEGPQHSYHRKESGLRIGEAILQVLGPYALTNDPAWDQSDGRMEVFQRASIVNLHPGGTGEIQKVIMARRLGIGRVVREQAGALA